MKDMIGYALLVVALVGVFGGLRMASGGTYIGLLGIAGGVACALFSYRLMSSAPAPATVERPEDMSATNQAPERVAEEA